VRADATSEEATVSATIGDVARLADVSVATVSRALRGLPNVAPATRARVIAAAQELHYVADPQASRLAAGRSSTIGVVVPRIGQWYYASILDAVDRIVGAANYDLLPFTLPDHDARERFLEGMPFRKRVEGLIVVDVPMADAELLRMASADIPIVTVGLRTQAFSSLTVDNLQGSRTVTEHLLALGHRRLGFIGGHQREPFNFPIPSLRRKGFEAALAGRGLVVDDTLVADAELTAAGGAEAMTQLMHVDERPTGVVVMADEMAFGAMQVAHDLGLRVPEDLSIVGFDDHELAEFVGLTTMRQDVPAQGRAAAGWLLEALVATDRLDMHHEVLPTRLLVRRTTAAPATVPA
jgi:LacI family repressor for deo operon, udp, cdd, tsx, nupC, and nupG